MWATIRWSGRTDWPSMCQVRCSTSSVSAMHERSLRRAPRGAARPARSSACRRRGCRPGCSAPLGVLDDLPRLGQVEHDAVEARSRRCPRSSRGARPGSARAPPRRGTTATFCVRLLGEVLAELVADDVGAGPQHGHRQRAGADARLEHPGAREDVGEHQDRAEVLRVDDLRAAGHLQHEVRQRRPQRRVGRALRRPHRRALGLADELVVGDEAGVGVELAARPRVTR